MKKTVIALILALGLIFSAAAQTSGPMDLVVLLDTSASMSDSYQQTSDYLIGPFLKEFLRIGDTFHLISFSKSPKVEISRRVEGVGDVETIIGRLLLMYPLDPNSDVPGALSFAEKYTASLPGNRHRKVVLVTDGDEGAAAVQTAITDSSARLRGLNSDLQYIKVPITGAPPVSGRPAAAARTVTPARVPAVQSAAQTPSQQTPVQPAAQPSQPSTGTQQSTGTSSTPSQQAQQAPVQQTQQQPPAQTQAPSQSPAQAQQPSGTPSTQASQPAQGTTDQQAPSQGQQTQQEQPDQIPSQQGTALQPGQDSQPSTESTGTQAAQPAQTPAKTPAQTSQTAQTAKSLDINDLPLPLIIGLIILALLILAFIIFLVSRNLHSSPNRVMAQASSPTILTAVPPEDNREMMSQYAEKQKSSGGPPLVYQPPKRKPLPKDKPVDQNLDFENGPPLLSLFVEDQNTAIGRRNIHAVKAGYTFSVGGGKSDFLIFLVPIPPHIADVSFDGRQCTFIPRKPQYFPDIGSQQVSNCIGKTVRVISDKNYELHIRIERYEDPLKALNNLLHSINVPGR